MPNIIRLKGSRRLIILIYVIILAAASVSTAAATDNAAHLGAPSVIRNVDSQTEPNNKPLDEIGRAFARLPLRFEPNLGQADARANFLARNRQYTLFLMPTEILITLNRFAGDKKSSEPGFHADPRQPASESRGLVRILLEGADPRAEIKGRKQLPGATNYILGNNPGRWHVNITNYERVEYREIYPGIHLVFYGHQGELEFDFVVTPGADPDIIRMSFGGIENLLADEVGNLIVNTAAGRLILHKPFIYQENHGIRNPIAGGFVLDPPNHIRLQVAAFDAGRPLVIDPRLQYSTFLGGEGSDWALDMALDPDGNVIITGETNSTNFPLKNPVRDDLLGSRDAFVTKFNPTLSSIIYSTYLGGSGEDRGSSVASDLEGNAYITGYTQSTNFPVTADALDKTCGSDGFCNPYISDVSISQYPDAFVSKLNPAGHLVYSTYLGGSESDYGRGIAVDGVASMYIAGATLSPDFPTTPGALQTGCGRTNPLATGCDWDAFVTKINPAGSELMYSTFFGGSGRDEAYDIALDTSPGLVSAAYIAGLTASRDFPATPGAIQHVNSNWSDGFVMKLNALGNSVLYATPLGGSEGDWINGITVDDYGNAYVTGTTWSTDFPTTAGAFDTTCGTDGNCNNTGTGNWMDAFVSKLNPSGTALIFSTYLGGSNKEFGQGIAVHAAAPGRPEAWVTGKTLSPDFPTLNPLQSSYGETEHTGGSGDVFVTRFNADGSGLVFSTYLGGIGPDGGEDIMVDKGGNAYITGSTTSDDFPTTLGAYQPDLQNPALVRGDAFVARIGERFVIPPLGLFWQLAVYLAIVFLAGLVFFGWRRIFPGK
jgi:hypothetical protein